MLIPEWVAAEIAAGRTELQHLLDTAPFDRAAVPARPQSPAVGEAEIRLGSISRFPRDLGVGAGDTVHLHFDTKGRFDVSL